MKIIVAILLSSFVLTTHAECVILLHGLARSESSMNKLENELIKNDNDGTSSVKFIFAADPTISNIAVVPKLNASCFHK